jgi:hypothetical protein
LKSSGPLASGLPRNTGSMSCLGCLWGHFMCRFGWCRQPQSYAGSGQQKSILSLFRCCANRSTEKATQLRMRIGLLGFHYSKTKQESVF